SELGRLSTQASRWSFSNISNSTQQSYRQCLSWTRHPLIQKNRKMVITCFLLLVVGLVYHVIFIYCALKGKAGYRFFYLPYFEK
ncbi:transmembrane protein 134, partial [Rhincodon typus]|uniref:transmembrane protein 134 n=1 Tax=Rhincodon typus TaxID=259920 RepID=UPI00202E0E3E